ncbi:hypothetical protein [Nocardia nova]|uniref:hypothetical protein n=1 Tax=Nocardia nova TaxID=37330 RepID=UPI0033F75C2C
MTGTGIAQSWPRSVEIATTASEALHGKLSDRDAHPALGVVCGMTQSYRQRRKDSQRFSAPPAVINWDQAQDRPDINPTERRLIAEFDRVADTVFDLGPARPGVLAARVVWWTVCEDIAFAIEAAQTYDDCIAGLSAKAPPNSLGAPAQRM